MAEEGEEVAHLGRDSSLPRRGGGSLQRGSGSLGAGGGSLVSDVS
jgi:hypothetical protein